MTEAERGAKRDKEPAVLFSSYGSICLGGDFERNLVGMPNVWVAGKTGGMMNFLLNISPPSYDCMYWQSSSRNFSHFSGFPHNFMLFN